MSRTGNLTLIPDEFWENDSGLAVHYVMSGDVVLPTSFGPEHVGRRWSVEVMSYLRFEGDRVCFEADFHDKGPAPSPSASRDARARRPGLDRCTRWPMHTMRPFAGQASSVRVPSS